jgi:bifunctional non-homologous end joining protein LigD
MGCPAVCHPQSYPAVTYIENGRCKLVSRNGTTFASFAILASSIGSSLQDGRAVLDGEIFCMDENGYPQFNDLLFHRREPCFFVFDVHSLEGYDLRNNALIERKAELRRLLFGVPLSLRVRYVDHVDTNGSGLFELICQSDWEGIVAKLRHGKYVSEREKSTWYKIRNPDYSQKVGREELFERDRRSEPAAGWHSCAVACAAVATVMRRMI